MSAMLRAAEPPTPQEVTRKLSLHAATKSPRIPKPIISGIESDVESLHLSPDVPPSPFLPMPGAQPPHALHSIAERARAESGEDDSDEEADDSAQRWAAAPKAEAEDIVIKNGYLWKKGERRKSWKKRWFVLRSTHIAYYKTSAEYRLLRLLDLGEVHSCVAVTLKRHENTFGIISPSRTYYLEAANSAETQEWITAINEQREKAFASNRNSVVEPSDAVASTSQPIPIPRTSSNSAPPAVPPASSPGYGMTTSDSEDGSISPNRPLGRKRSQSQTMAMPSTSGSQGVTFAPTTPKVSTDWDTSKVVISGYLLKCGSKRRNWRKRWFVLTGEKLFYAGTHMDAKAHREIPLVQVIDALEVHLDQHGPRAGAPLASPGVPPITNTMSPPNGPDRDPYGQHTFKVVTTKRTLLLCAPGEEEEIKWLSAVRAVIARRAPPTPSIATALDGPPMLGGPSSSHVSAHVAAGSSSSGQGSALLRGKVRRSSVSGSRVSETQEEQAPYAADKRA